MPSTANMLPVLWRSKARLSLAQINNYIADRNPTAAQRLKDAIEQAASNLPQHPYLYRTGLVAGTHEIACIRTMWWCTGLHPQPSKWSTCCIRGSNIPEAGNPISKLKWCCRKLAPTGLTRWMCSMRGLVELQGGQFNRNQSSHVPVKSIDVISLHPAGLCYIIFAN